MSSVRIALATPPFPSHPRESVALAVAAIGEAGRAGASIVAFPECFVPGYRGFGRAGAAPDQAFLEEAWHAIARAAADAAITVVLGTERVTDGGVVASVLVINSDGSRAGFQDKVQIDPSEEGTYVPGNGRQLFQAGPLTFGVVICHEGFRYPETVRWAARRGAQVVFHPHYSVPLPDFPAPHGFGDAANSFHEKAMLCRAAENGCYFASVNCAVPGSPTTSAVIRPDGTLLASLPHGREGLLLADLELSLATRLLATRYRPLD